MKTQGKLSRQSIYHYQDLFQSQYSFIFVSLLYFHCYCIFIWLNPTLSQGSKYYLFYKEHEIGT